MLPRCQRQEGCVLEHSDYAIGERIYCKTLDVFARIVGFVGTTTVLAIIECEAPLAGRRYETTVSLIRKTRVGE